MAKVKEAATKETTKKPTKAPESDPAPPKQERPTITQDDRERALEWFETIRNLSLVDALTMAQREMRNPPLNGTSNMFKTEYKYSKLDVVMDVVRPACNAWGILFEQPIKIERYQVGDVPKTRELLQTVVTKGEETRIMCETELPAYADEKNRGATLTYFRRQEATAAFGLAGEEDTTEYMPSKEEYQYENSPYDKAAKEEKDYLEKTEKLDQLKERMKVANVLGLDNKEIKKWTVDHIGKQTSHMSLAELDRVIFFINDWIEDYEAVDETSEAQETMFGEEIEYS